MHVKEQWANAVKENNLYLLREPNAVLGRAMAHAVSRRRPPTAETRPRSRVSLCGISGG